MSRTVVITGTSSGIGLATAIAFARAGDTVVATMRNLERRGPLDEAAAQAGVKLDVLALDVTLDESVAACFAEVGRRHGAIDVLVNNAGQGSSGTLEELTIEDLQAQLDVNYLGVARTTKVVLPAMRAAGAGRVIAVSSVAGGMGQPFNDAYCAAKHALEGLFESLYPVAARFGVYCSIVEPGPVKGVFRANGAPAEGRDPASPYTELFERYSAATAGDDRAQATEGVADVIVQVAGEAEPKLRYQSSSFTTKLVGFKLADLTGENVTGLTGRWLT